MAKVVKRENIAVVIRKYEDNEGVQRSVWKTVAEITTFQKDDGTYSKMAELYFMPGKTLGVFERKAKENKKDQAPAEAQPEQPAQPAEDEIQVENMPF